MASESATHSLGEQYREVRATTSRLREPLSEEDCTVQSMEDASPAKWHLAHTSWFFETFVLEAIDPNYRCFHPEFRVLFNSYYNSVGDQHPRPRRGLLSRPPLHDVLRYREHVDEQMMHLLDPRRNEPLPAGIADVIELGLHHEQQHQELILTDAKHMLSCNPLRPAYHRDLPSTAPAEVKPLRWHWREAGTRWIGHEGSDFSFDNERPRHRVFLDSFEFASRPVVNGEYLAFMEDGGYQRPELWLSDGRATSLDEDWNAPLYWEKRDGVWMVMTLAGLRKLRLDEPVCHVSYFEADAYATWVCARLPNEAEWEVMASEVPEVEGNFIENGLLHPVPTPAGDPESGPAQLFGDVWEWTQSAYGSYPGYSPPEGALGEYNGKFMCSQMVLRGGSCATPRSHIRATYRNFFYPASRWQFSGIRLARDGR
ncbi:MAG: ergothioneine biosynthesis protein EgtB [Proteobacteria bacterium]|nr:ergothioneine biosynthesis protein EgtB [Pseudomonadota bacterium]